MRPLASIVITTFNSAQFIEPTLKSALDQKFDPKKYEVVVVDDGSKDKTVYILRDYAKSYKNLRLVIQKNQGPAAARTVAIKEAKGQFVLMMSHDCIATAAWITEVIKAFEKDPKIGMVQGQLLPLESINRPFFHCNNFTTPRITFDTAEIAYRATALDKAGRYFEQKFSANGDDADLGWRIIEAGYKYQWVDKVLMHHIILPRRFSSDLKALPAMSLFPYLIHIHPSMRQALPYKILWGSKFKYLLILSLFIAAILVVFGFWQIGLIAILTVLIFNLYRVLRSTSDYTISPLQKFFLVFPHRLLFDSLLGIYLIIGSIKYRSIVL